MRDKNYRLAWLIRFTRLSRKLTQADLAKILEISPRHLQYIESGEKMPGYDLLCRLVHKLELSPDAIYYPERQVENPKLNVLIEKLRILDERDFDVVCATVDALLK